MQPEVQQPRPNIAAQIEFMPEPPLPLPTIAAHIKWTPKHIACSIAECEWCVGVDGEQIGVHNSGQVQVASGLRWRNVAARSSVPDSDVNHPAPSHVNPPPRTNNPPPVNQTASAPPIGPRPVPQT